jgi:hypothetical protein
MADQPSTATTTAASTTRMQDTSGEPNTQLRSFRRPLYLSAVDETLPPGKYRASTGSLSNRHCSTG